MSEEDLNDHMACKLFHSSTIQKNLAARIVHFEYQGEYKNYGGFDKHLYSPCYSNADFKKGLRKIPAGWPHNVNKFS